VYADNIVMLTFEKGGVCISADYALLEDGSGISVHNAQRQGSPEGQLSTIDGNATQPDPSDPGKLGASVLGS
jgi:hypothetical protein